MPSFSGKLVCVTGAGGFIGSWIVKLLLEKGYTVRGTVRNPDDPKNSHLKEFEGAKERLIICKADLLDYKSLFQAIDGCDGVFHLASPMINRLESVEPAVNGANNVIIAAAEAQVHRVVFSSSFGAMTMQPSRPPNMIVDESCWSDLEFCKSTKNWYCYGKVLAEQVSWEIANNKGVDLVVVVPALVIGSMLQSTLNVSNHHVLNHLSGFVKTYKNEVQGYVHVKDAALAHILVYETPGAFGRYICVESILHRADMVEILTKLFPEYPIPKKCGDEMKPRAEVYKFSNEKLKDLGLEFIPVRQALYDTVKSLQEKGHLPILTQHKVAARM